MTCHPPLGPDDLPVPLEIYVGSEPEVRDKPFTQSLVGVDYGGFQEGTTLKSPQLASQLRGLPLPGCG